MGCGVVKRAAWVGIAVVLLVVLGQVALLLGTEGPADERALTPPVGELLVLGAAVLLFAVSFAVSLALQWWRRRVTAGR